MELAKVHMTANPSSVHTHTAPSRESYTFRHYTGGRKDWVPVGVLEDAAYFDDHESFAVQWTPAGRIARAASGTVDGAKSLLSKLGYREKQQLAKDHGIKANQSEEDLDEELQEVVEQFAEDMKYQ